MSEKMSFEHQAANTFVYGKRLYLCNISVVRGSWVYLLYETSGGSVQLKLLLSLLHTNKAFCKLMKLILAKRYFNQFPHADWLHNFAFNEHATKQTVKMVGNGKNAIVRFYFMFYFSRTEFIWFTIILTKDSQ